MTTRDDAPQFILAAAAFWSPAVGHGLDEGLVWALCGLAAGVLTAALIIRPDWREDMFHEHPALFALEPFAGVGYLITRDVRGAVVYVFCKVFAKLGIDDLSETEARYLGGAILGVAFMLAARYLVFNAPMHGWLCKALDQTPPRFACEPPHKKLCGSTSTATLIPPRSLGEAASRSRRNPCRSAFFGALASSR
jgi:hypothetical protein